MSPEIRFVQGFCFKSRFYDVSVEPSVLDGLKGHSRVRFTCKCDKPDGVKCERDLVR
jgi:hypothetical protein